MLQQFTVMVSYIFTSISDNEVYRETRNSAIAEKKFDDIFNRLDAAHQRDRETDGRTDGHRATAKTALTHSVARVEIHYATTVSELFRMFFFSAVFNTFS